MLRIVSQKVPSQSSEISLVFAIRDFPIAARNEVKRTAARIRKCLVII